VENGLKRSKCGNGEGREGTCGGGLAWSKDNEEEGPEIKYICVVEITATGCKGERGIQNTQRLQASFINVTEL